MQITVQTLHPTARLPEYRTAGAAGADVFACFQTQLFGKRAFVGSPGCSVDHVFLKDVGRAVCQRCGEPLPQHLPAVILRPGARLRVPTGLRLGVPHGYEIQVRPRSGLALDHGITLANSPGTIDSDYRGELEVALWNTTTTPYLVLSGDRIAQIVVSTTPPVRFVEGTVPVDTARGAAGFGSTGK